MMIDFEDKMPAPMSLGEKVFMAFIMQATGILYPIGHWIHLY